MQGECNRREAHRYTNREIHRIPFGYERDTVITTITVRPSSPERIATALYERARRPGQGRLHAALVIAAEALDRRPGGAERDRDQHPPARGDGEQLPLGGFVG